MELKRILAIGVILLFVGVTLAPIMNANDDVISSNTFSIPKKEDTVSITILEYKPDGTVERTVVSMSCEQADSFHEEMANTQDLNTRLSIYKKYNLISQDVTVDSLREGMEERAQEMGLTRNGFISLFRTNRTLLPVDVHKNIFCSVSGGEEVWWGFIFPILNIRPSIIHFITDCSFSSKGLCGEFNLGWSDIIILVGFVGFVDLGGHETWRGIDYSGFCVYAQARGDY